MRDFITCDWSSEMNDYLYNKETGAFKEINETSNIIKKQSLTIKDYIPLGFAVMCIILALITMIKAMRNLGKLFKKSLIIALESLIFE